MNNMIEIKHFEILAGSDINEIAQEAVKLANKGDCKVVFNFNSVELHVYYFSKAQEIVDEYYIKWCQK